MRRDEKIIERYKHYRQVQLYTGIIGPILKHLKGYSKPENFTIFSSFRTMNSLIYKLFRADLLASAPSKDADKIEHLRHNDSIHALKVLYLRFQREALRRGTRS